MTGHRQEDGLTGWIPFRVRSDVRPAVVDWCYLGTERFTAPFFADTVERCLRKPFNQLFLQETGIETLLDRAVSRPGLRPTAFIFHVSRCGSTLLAQMAASLPNTNVLSEAVPIDDVLRAAEAEDVRIAWLGALISALGQPREAADATGDGVGQHLLVKFDAWHSAQIPLVQRAFPDVPCVFLYRDPDAVVASQLRMPGVHMVPGTLDPAAFGLDPASALQVDREEYVCRVLGSIYAAGARCAAEGRVTLLNYADFPARAMSQVLEWCAPSDLDAARRRVDDAARFDAKTPSLPYEAPPRASPSDRARDMAARFIASHYAQLEGMRMSSGR